MPPQTPTYEMDPFRTPGFAWRVGLSIGVVFGWLVFLIIWLFFYAGDRGVFQNIAIFLVSVLIGVGILAVGWATWGIRYAKATRAPHFDKPRGTVIINAVAGIGWLIFLVIWLFYYADTYTGYQNLAIFIASLLVLGAIMSSAWAVRWLRTRGRR